MITLQLPSNLDSITSGQREFSFDAESVSVALSRLFEQFPQLAERFRKPTGELRQTLLFFVNGDDIRFVDGENTALRPGDQLTIVPANAGG